MDAGQWRRVSVAFVNMLVHELRLEEDANSLEMATDEERPVALPQSLGAKADAVPVAGPCFPNQKRVFFSSKSPVSRSWSTSPSRPVRMRILAKTEWHLAVAAAAAKDRLQDESA